MFNNNKTILDIKYGYYRNYCLNDFPTWLYGMENSPVDFKILNNFNFQDCYSLKEFVLPMSNKVVYEGAIYLSGN